MAKQYFEKLSKLVTTLNFEHETNSQLEIKHFFSGAALYSDGQMCASWSPAGLAFKLPDQEANDLIGSGEAIPLKYFPKGHIKSGYALFENPADFEDAHWKPYFLKAVTVAMS